MWSDLGVNELLHRSASSWYVFFPEVLSIPCGDCAFRSRTHSCGRRRTHDGETALQLFLSLHILHSIWRLLAQIWWRNHSHFTYLGMALDTRKFLILELATQNQWLRSLLPLPEREQLLSSRLSSKQATKSPSLQMLLPLPSALFYPQKVRARQTVTKDKVMRLIVMRRWMLELYNRWLILSIGKLLLTCWKSLWTLGRRDWGRK